ncbi:hypothetical protein A2U12_10145 [Fusobacterium necrophorum subsp. funduliforme]|nr:hypothetical protein A2U12_10145 [Fusobacterium necrophorum subsp. funduliforme]
MLSLFSSISVDKSLSILLIILKNQLLVLLIFLYFSILYLVYLCSNLYYFLPSVALDSVCSFSSSLL